MRPTTVGWIVNGRPGNNDDSIPWGLAVIGRELIDEETSYGVKTEEMFKCYCERAIR